MEEKVFPDIYRPRAYFNVALYVVLMLGYTSEIYMAIPTYLLELQLYRLCTYSATI